MQPDRTDLSGQTLGSQFSVTRKLGEGGMGQVYLARQLDMERDVVIKVMHPELTAGSPSAVERFKREARSIARLNHPHIVQVYVFGQTDEGLLFLAMEYVDGQSLEQLLQTSAHLAEPRTLRIIDQICSALAEAHGNGIIHRDLKPDNIMLSARHGNADYVNVLDFGIAKMVGPEDVAMTKTGSLFGTPQYMAPEQARGAAVDSRADVYAIGVILYRMLTGSLPFKADTAMGLLFQVVTEPARRPSSVPGTLAPSPRVETMVMRCLEKDPADRFQSVGELQREIRLALQDHPASVRGYPTPPERTPSLRSAANAATQRLDAEPVEDPAVAVPPPKGPSRRRMYAVLGVLAGIALGTFGAITWLERGHGRDQTDLPSVATRANQPANKEANQPANKEASNTAVPNVAVPKVTDPVQDTETTGQVKPARDVSTDGQEPDKASPSRAPIPPARAKASTGRAGIPPAGKRQRGLPVPKAARLLSRSDQAISLSTTLSREDVLRFYEHHARRWGRIKRLPQGLQIEGTKTPVSFVSVYPMSGGLTISLVLTGINKQAQPKETPKSVFGAPLAVGAEEYMRTGTSAIYHVPGPTRPVMQFYRKRFAQAAGVNILHNSNVPSLVITPTPGTKRFSVIMVTTTPISMRAGGPSTQIMINKDPG